MIKTKTISSAAEPLKGENLKKAIEQIKIKKEGFLTAEKLGKDHKRNKPLAINHFSPKDWEIRLNPNPEIMKILSNFRYDGTKKLVGLKWETPGEYGTVNKQNITSISKDELRNIRYKSPSFSIPKPFSDRTIVYHLKKRLLKPSLKIMTEVKAGTEKLLNNGKYRQSLESFENQIWNTLTGHKIINPDQKNRNEAQIKQGILSYKELKNISNILQTIAGIKKSEQEEILFIIQKTIIRKMIWQKLVDIDFISESNSICSVKHDVSDEKNRRIIRKHLQAKKNEIVKIYRTIALDAATEEQHTLSFFPGLSVKRLNRNKEFIEYYTQIASELFDIAFKDIISILFDLQYCFDYAIFEELKYSDKNQLGTKITASHDRHWLKKPTEGPIRKKEIPEDKSKFILLSDPAHGTLNFFKSEVSRVLQRGKKIDPDSGKLIRESTRAKVIEIDLENDVDKGIIHPSNSIFVRPGMKYGYGIIIFDKNIGNRNVHPIGIYWGIKKIKANSRQLKYLNFSLNNISAGITSICKLKLENPKSHPDNTIKNLIAKIDPNISALIPLNIQRFGMPIRRIIFEVDTANCKRIVAMDRSFIIPAADGNTISVKVFEPYNSTTNYNFIINPGIFSNRYILDKLTKILAFKYGVRVFCINMPGRSSETKSDAPWNFDSFLHLYLPTLLTWIQNHYPGIIRLDTDTKKTDFQGIISTKKINELWSALSFENETSSLYLEFQNISDFSGKISGKNLSVETIKQWIADNFAINYFEQEEIDEICYLILKNQGTFSTFEDKFFLKRGAIFEHLLKKKILLDNTGKFSTGNGIYMTENGDLYQQKDLLVYDKEKDKKIEMEWEGLGLRPEAIKILKKILWEVYKNQFIGVGHSMGGMMLRYLSSSIDSLRHLYPNLKTFDIESMMAGMVSITSPTFLNMRFEGPVSAESLVEKGKISLNDAKIILKILKEQDILKSDNRKSKKLLEDRELRRVNLGKYNHLKPYISNSLSNKQNIYGIEGFFSFLRDLRGFLKALDKKTFGQASKITWFALNNAQNLYSPQINLNGITSFIDQVLKSIPFFKKFESTVIKDWPIIWDLIGSPNIGGPGIHTLMNNVFCSESSKVIFQFSNGITSERNMLSAGGKIDYTAEYLQNFRLPLVEVGGSLDVLANIEDIHEAFNAVKSKYKKLVVFEELGHFGAVFEGQSQDEIAEHIMEMVDWITKQKILGRPTN